MYGSHSDLAIQINNLKEELFLLKQTLTASKPSPKTIIKPTKPSTSEACCQTSVPSDMKIEPKIIPNPRRTIRCTSLQRKKVDTKKHIKREGMER